MLISEFAKLVDRTEEVIAENEYPQVGVRIKGNGAYARETLKGSDTKYKKFSKVKVNDIIVNKIWARGGSVSVVQPELDGFYCSSEYPLFEIDTSIVNPRWFYWISKQKWFWKLCEDKSGGTSGKNRIKPKLFLDIDVPIPSLGKQTELLSKIDSCSERLIVLNKKIESNSKSIYNLKQAILSEELCGEVQNALLKQDSDEPFILPNSWNWELAENVCDYIQRGKSPKYVEKSSVPVVSQKCVQWGQFIIDRARFISEESLDKYKEERFLQQGDLLWNSTGDGTIGRICAYVPDDRYDKVVADSHVTILRPNKRLIVSRFLLYWLSSKFIQKNLNVSGSTKQTELGTGTVKKQVVPLPPLEEQKRIVAKIDELMQLCDELESRVEENQKNSDALMNSILREAFEVET